MFFSKKKSTFLPPLFIFLKSWGKAGMTTRNRASASIFWEPPRILRGSTRNVFGREDVNTGGCLNVYEKRVKCVHPQNCQSARADDPGTVDSPPVVEIPRPAKELRPVAGKGIKWMLFAAKKSMPADGNRCLWRRELMLEPKDHRFGSPSHAFDIVIVVTITVAGFLDQKLPFYFYAPRTQ